VALPDSAPREDPQVTMFAVAPTSASLSRRAHARVIAPRARGVAARPATSVVAKASPDDSSANFGQRAAAALAALSLAASPGVAFAKGTPTYIAELTPTTGSNVKGSFKFEPFIDKSNQEKVQITASLQGLAPGLHAINIHENGNVECADGSCTGASWNPQDRPHGGPNSLKKFGASACHFVGEGCLLWRHIGDLGNVTANESGVVEDTFKDQYIALRDGKNMFNVTGRSIVVRQGADDLTTQSDDGGAGKILAYGTIKQAT
jgi:Cu-Zn family superoxide dismutase